MRCLVACAGMQVSRVTLLHRLHCRRVGRWLRCQGLQGACRVKASTHNRIRAWRSLFLFLGCNLWYIWKYLISLHFWLRAWFLRCSLRFIRIFHDFDVLGYIAAIWPLQFPECALSSLAFDLSCILFIKFRFISKIIQLFFSWAPTVSQDINQRFYCSAIIGCDDILPRVTNSRFDNSLYPLRRTRTHFALASSVHMALSVRVSITLLTIFSYPRFSILLESLDILGWQSLSQPTHCLR